MKNNKMIKILSLLIITIHSAYATQVIDISDASDCLELKQYYSKNDSNLNIIIDCFINNKTPTSIQKVTDLTPDEAKQNFYEYIKDTITYRGLNIDNTNIQELFTEKYFGVAKQDNILSEEPQCIVNEDEQVLYALQSLQRDRPMTDHLNQLSLRALLLTPEQLFEACVNNKNCGDLLNPKNFEDYARTYPERIDKFFSTKHLSIPENSEQRKIHFKNNTIGFFSIDLVWETLNIANTIMQHSIQGDNIVILGNSPYFIGKALEYKISTDKFSSKHRNIIKLPFSGVPNAARRKNGKVCNKDIVTQDRRQHILNVLRTVGLSKDNPNLVKNTTYFIDIVCKGIGMTYVMKQILSNFKEQEVVPKFGIFCLNDVTEVNSEILPEEINIHDLPTNIDFIFPTRYTPHLRIPAHIVKFRYRHMLGIIAHDDWRMFPSYNACYWNKKYDYMLEENSFERNKVLNEYFDTIVHYFSENYSTSIGDKKILSE